MRTDHADLSIQRLASMAKERLATTRARAQHVHEAVNRYVANIERGIASDLAQRNGLALSTQADDGTGAALSPASLPLLVAPVYIVCGQARPERVHRLTQRSGVVSEWISLDDHEERELKTLVGRIERGVPSGIVLLNGRMGHRGYARVVESARRVALPLAYAERGGNARLERALEQLENALKQRARAAAAVEATQ